MQIKIGRVYAWDPTREDPDNPQTLLVVSKQPFELIGIDSPAPSLRRAPDWGSARYGMLGVELFGDMLAEYERWILDAEPRPCPAVETATEFGVDAVEKLEDLVQYSPGETWVIHPPDPRGLRLVTFRSVEVIQAYAGWLWNRQVAG